ncbi:MAG TPA: SAM-dependent methyltransferase [Candidatus Sulfotelmatobacter sp.]|nr:SAM-dependent methyltransferase [Candidatus Sulfotelmatobacter sp.]
MTPLAELLAERIRRFGPITFAEYMRECLYHPVYGYYSQPEARKFADYYTSVDVHAIFGRLLARQFAEMREQLGRPREFRLVEAAAGTGRLAGQILDFAEAQLPEFYGALRYVAVERSPARCEQLAGRLARHASRQHCEARIDMPGKIEVGCVFSNELLDALPVHRVAQENGALREIFVASEGGNFSEVRLPLSTCAISEYFAAQNIALIEGQQAEAGLEACDWISEIGRRLERGFVLTIDYGHEAADLFDEHHMAGTVLAYANHRASEDWFAAPGEQDLTAHVNFTALRLWGERGGLRTLGLVSQTAFLLALGQRNEFADLYDGGMSEAERVRARLQLKTLIYPEGMGERFQVLVQQKSEASAKLTGLSGI